MKGLSSRAAPFLTGFVYGKMGLREHKDNEAAFLKGAAIFCPNRDEASVFFFSFYTNEPFFGPADMQNRADV